MPRIPFSEAKRRIRNCQFYSRAISAVFHPLAMPTFLFFFIVKFSPFLLGYGDTEHQYTFLALIFITTFILPLIVFILNIFLIEKKFSFKKLFMEDRKERILPFLFTGIFYTGLTYMLQQSEQVNVLVILILACISVCILMVALVSVFWKISAHATGISGMIGLMIFLQKSYSEAALLAPVMVSILIAGLLLSARLYLKAHTPAQIFAGVLLGIAVSGILFFVT